jgi:hypothetical protein
MGKLTELISEQRGRRENPDRIRATFCIFFDPVTKCESVNLPRRANVIGGPELRQETGESVEAFEARVEAAVEETKIIARSPQRARTLMS